ncbi:hypothetical protein GCM10010915_25280 [Microbacterium faecale]|uniref:Uncharacterized protein n=2 Tax=Microbacterium faecale TaxID=1804630 RepID=A0A916YG07_9MICO|nr:hypothetical protein GCM10010915_25280 [Microbacterium faecale]
MTLDTGAVMRPIFNGALEKPRILMSVHDSIRPVLASVDRTLSIADMGWRDYLAGGERRYAGLANAITFTRSATNVIQNLRSHVDGFDAWWKQEVQILDNPIAKWFVEVRNRVEKHTGRSDC